MAEYKIELGVKLDTNDIQTQINNIKVKPINLDVQIDNRSLQSQINNLRTNPVEINVRLDDQDALRRVNNLRQQLLELANIRMNPGGGNGGNGGNGRRQADDVIRAYRELISLQNRIGTKQQKVARLDTSQNQREILELSNTIDVLYERYQRIYNLFNRQFSNVQLDGLNRSFQITRENLNEIVVKADDARRALANSINDNLNNGGFESQIAKLDSDIGKLQNVSDGVRRAMEDVRFTFNEMRMASSSGNIRDLISANELYEQSLKAVNNQLKINKISDTSSVKQQTQAYKELLSISKQISSIELNIGKLKGKGGNTNQIAELENQLRILQLTYQRLVSTMNTPLTTSQWNSLYTEIASTQDKLGQLNAKIADTKTKLASGIKLKLSDGTFANDISNIETKFNNLSSQSVELKAKIDKVKQALQAMEAAASGNNSDRLISASERYEKALKDVENQLRINARAEKADDNSYILENKKSAMLAEVNQWLKENSKAAKMFGVEIKQVQNALLNCKTGAQFKNISSDFNRIKKEAKDAGVATQTFTDKLSKQFDRYKNYFSVASMFMYATMGLKDMFRQVVSIDTAMTELKKVTDETNASYNKFLTNAADKAKEIGTTIDGLISSTADFARLGYDFADAQGLAQVANIYAVVGDEINGVEGATESLVSTLAAFKHEMNGMDDADFALSIVDKFNEVSNNFAISSGGIGEALKRSASSMAAANNTLDETIALITAANTVVQDPDRVGNAFKTVSMRIRGAKTELEEAGLETEGMAESTAKLRQEIMALSGVDIMLNENTFKSTYQIMDELSQKWEGLSDIAQASIIELIAGKHQGNVVQSLMSNFDIAREALETSMNSAGSAMKEHEKWQDSLEARINKLKAAWQGLSQAFMSSDFLKVVISSVTTLVDWLTKLIDTIGTLPTLLGAFAGFKILLTLLKSGGLSGGLKGLFGLKDILSLLSLAFPNTANGATKLISAFKGLSSTGGATGGVLTKLFGLLKNPYVAIATIAITALTAAFRHQKKEAKELAEEVEKTVSSYKDQHGELIKLKNDYDTSNEDSMISKYKELSKGVNDLGENMALTSDEYMEYHSIVNTIAEQIPSLVSGYDEQGNAILSCKGNVDQLTDAYQRLIHAQNQDVLTKAGNIEQDFENTIKEAEKGSFLGIGDKVSTPSIELLEEILNGDYSKREITNLLNNAKTSTVDGIYEALKDAGIGDLGSSWSNGEIADVLSKQLKSDPSKIKSVVKDYFTQFNEAVEEQKTIAKAKLSDAFDVSSAITEGTDYSNISDTLQNIAEQTVNNLDYDFFANLKKQGRTVEQWTTEMLDQLNSISESNVDKIEAAFDLQTKFNGGEISYGEYVKGVEDVGALVDKLGLNQEITSQIKLNLGLSESTVKDGKWVVKEYENLLNRLTSEEYEIQLDTETAKAFLDDLSSEELNVVVNFVKNKDVDFTNALQNYKGALQHYESVLGEAEKASVDFSKTVYGNIDTNARQVLEWTSDNLEKYKDALMSWAGDNAVWDEVKKSYEGTISTVDTSLSSYKIDGKEVEFAITPLLQTDNGPEYLSAGIVDTYMDRLIDKATADGKWDNAELFALDAEGLEIDGKKIKGLLADIGETAEATAEQMHFVGKDGALALAEAELSSVLAIIEKQAKINEAMNFKIDMAVETSGLEAFNAAMAESVSGVGLTSESISVLKGRYSELASQGYDLSAMFEETANGIHLNRRAVDELEQALASQKLEETEGHLDVLKQTYDELTEEIKNCTDAGERANLYTEQQEIARKINDLATLASQYEGLTSAYNAWQNAESAGSERDMYENVITGFKTMDDEISRGWIDDSSIAFLELLTGRTDLAVASTEELKNAYKGLSKDINSAGYSIRDFFTVDADGNSTNTGVYNFLETVEAQYKGIEDVIKKKDGQIIGFDFNVLAEEDENGNIIKNGDQVIAEALGISEELVQIMLRAADDAGFVVTLDGKWTQLADLKDSAQIAGDELKRLKENSEFLKDLSNEDLNFNFNANNLSDLNSEFEKAYNVLEKFKNEDGTLMTDADGNLVEGAQQALDIATYYQAAIDKLTEPAYMQLDASQVEENLRDPLAKMQEFQDLVKTKHQLVLEGKSLEETEAKMTEIAEYLQGLGEEQKIGLGIDPSLSTEEIKSKLEKGEIEIPATVDIQVEMSEELKDIKLLLMKQLGLVEGEEVKLKIGYDIDDSVVDTLTDKEMKVAVKYIEENKKWFDGLTSEEQEIAVKLIADGEVDTSIIDKKIEEELNSKENAGETEVSTDVTVDANNVDTTGVEEAVYNKLENGNGGFSSFETSADVDVNADNVDVSNVEESIVDKLNNYTPLLENVVTDADIEVKAFAKIFGIEEVDDLKLKLDGLTDEQIVIFTQVLGQMDVEKLKTTISGLDDETVQIIAEAIGTGDVETLKNTINGLDSKTVQAIAEAFGFADVTELNSAIENLDPKTVQAIAQALGIKDVNSLRDAIKRLKGKDVKATASVKGKKDVDNLRSSINSLKGKTITVWAEIKKRASSLWDKFTGGSGGVDGTAHVSGTAYSNGTANKNTVKNSGRAFKQGDWGTKDSGVALGAELGPELLVRNGKWHLIGEDGAQFFGYRKGDIIFNADQTREIFEKGKITHGNGRGRALASGTAFSSGTGGFGKVNGNTVSVEADTVNVNSNKTTTSSSSDTKKETSSDSKESAEEFEESIDWIEIAIDRLERSIGQLDTKANSAYRSWEERNGAIVEQIGKTREEIELQQKAYERYMQEAANVGLSSDWITKIQNGSIDIETITDEELAEKIKQYQEWFEKALDCKDAIIELQEAESELYKQRFDNVLAQYEGMLSIIEHEKNMLDEFVAQSEAQGWLISEKYYEALIGNEQKQIAKLEEEKSALLSELQTAMQSGKIAKNSEAWYEMVSAIDEVTLSIEESRTAILEYQQAIEKLKWEQFDLLQDQISSVTQEAEFLIDLMSNKKLFDDNGQLTDEGQATMGMHGVAYNIHMNQADQYGAEAKRLEAEMANDPYDMELEARYREVIALQQEAILAAEDEKNAIRDLVEEGINLELEALQERIDLYNENLDSAKDLYEYNKKVKEQTEEIAALEKQIASYKNDDSEETRAKLQELKVALEDARLELEETQYDKFIDDQTKLLDDLYLEYETILNTRLDNIDGLVMDMIEQINANAGDISSTIYEASDAVGYTLSDSMQTILSADAANTESMIAMYQQGFSTLNTTTNTALNAIKIKLDNMIAALNAMAAEKVIEAENSSAANSPEANAPPTTPTTPTPTEPPKEETKQPTLTNDQLMGIAASIWVDGSRSGWGNDPIRSGKLKEKFNESIAKQVQSLINKHGPNGDLYNFWIKNGQNLDKYHYSAFKSGARNIDEAQLAWTQEQGKEFIVRPSDGAILTPIAKGDSVLNANASRNIWNMANSPAEFIKDNLNLGIASTPNNSTVQNSYVQNFENITFSLPNVHGYSELLTEMQRDPKFEKLILSMTVDRIAGKSSLAKGKAIR